MKRVVLLVLFILSFVSCDSYIEIPEKHILLEVDPVDPVFYPTPSYHTSGESVKIYTDEENASVLYTLDGTEPDFDNYFGGANGSVVVENVTNVTIKAISVKNGYKSDVVNYYYK